jgi:hypothetical protein
MGRERKEARATAGGRGTKKYQCASGGRSGSDVCGSMWQSVQGISKVFYFHQEGETEGEQLTSTFALSFLLPLVPGIMILTPTMLRFVKGQAKPFTARITPDHAIIKDVPI